MMTGNSGVNRRELKRRIAAGEIKPFRITDADLDKCGDWLVGDVAARFVEGGYTHVRYGRAISEAKICHFPTIAPGVLLGGEIGTV
ncbi:MAG: hypothetical protein P1P81_08180 [Desulfobulbales bacterium]|nr:hypothetical protein [Desulfobulbales bacterium]